MENQNSRLQYLKRQMEAAVMENKYEEAERFLIKAKVLSIESSDLEEMEKLYQSIKPILEKRRQSKTDEKNKEREYLESRKKQQSNKMALYAAVTFFICALIGCIQQFIYFYFQGLVNQRLLSETIPTFFISISLFGKKKDIMPTIAFSLRMLSKIYWLIVYFSTRFSTNNLLSTIATVIILVIIFVSSSKYSSVKSKELCKKIWFLPLVFAIVNIVFSSSFTPYLYLTVSVSSITEIAAFTFLGLWIKE